MTWNWIYMGSFWVQIFTELSRKSQDYISQKQGFHIKLMRPKSHWIPRKSSQNVKYWQNLTDLCYQAVKFHRTSSSQIFAESSRLNLTEWWFHGKIKGPINTELPQNSLSSKCLKAKKILTECYCKNLTDLPYQAVKFHRTSSSQNLTGQKSHRGAWGNIHWNAFFIVHFSWQSPFFHTKIFTGFKVAEMFSTFLRYRESPKIHGTASFIVLGLFTPWKQGCRASESSPIWIHKKIKLLFSKPCVKCSICYMQCIWNPFVPFLVIFLT